MCAQNSAEPAVTASQVTAAGREPKQIPLIRQRAAKLIRSASFEAARWASQIVRHQSSAVSGLRRAGHGAQHLTS